jgi:hypothetical protein
MFFWFGWFQCYATMMIFLKNELVNHALKLLCLDFNHFILPVCGMHSLFDYVHINILIRIIFCDMSREYSGQPIGLVDGCTNLCIMPFSQPRLLIYTLRKKGSG